MEIRVSSYLLNGTTGERTSTSASSDLNPHTLLLTFGEGDTVETFTLEIINEETPEFEEQFELVLMVESSTGDSADGARLGSASTSLVVVAENDDPHGLFVVAAGTSDMEVAEDVGEGEEGGSVEVMVEREFGTAGRVQVSMSNTHTHKHTHHIHAYSPVSGDVGGGPRARSSSSILH